jgi:hypothetical protein
MALPSTKPLDGEFWYVLDDERDITWRPRPRIRGDFYLGWLGQNKTVAGAGLVRLERGRITHVCTHGTPYYWLQPYVTLPLTSEALHDHDISGADSMVLDFSLAGWGLRDQTVPETRTWPDTSLSESALAPLLEQAVHTIVYSFRSEGEPSARPAGGGLLARAVVEKTGDPQDELLDLLGERLGASNVVLVLAELVKHDIHVMPAYRQSDFFERLCATEGLPPASKVARVVMSAVYHLAPVVGSRRLNSMLLLNSLRQRHPFDVTWGADFLVKCFGMPSLVRLLQVALVKEESDQMRGNVLDLLQELGYGISVGLETEVQSGLADLSTRQDLGAFEQVVRSHLDFLGKYIAQRDSAA